MQRPDDDATLDVKHEHGLATATAESTETTELMQLLDKYAAIARTTHARSKECREA